MNVAGLAAHSPLEKAHEVANECRRLNKALKECQDLANTYNTRERLFGMPITSVITILIFIFHKNINFYIYFSMKN